MNGKLAHALNWIAYVVCVFVIAIQPSCSRSPGQTFYRWTGELLPNDLQSANIAIQIPNTDYVNGYLVVRGKIARQEFLRYARATGCELEAMPAFTVPQSPPNSLDWWKPPEIQREVFMKRVSPKGDWIRLLVWSNGEMFLWQNGPFE